MNLGARKWSSPPTEPRTLRLLRHEKVCLRGIGRRNERRLLLRLARYRANRPSCRLHRLLARVLREDNRAVVRAASQASKAADYILGFLPEDQRPAAMASDSDERKAA